MTHLAPAPPGEPSLGPQRTWRSFEHPPEESPESVAAKAHADGAARTKRAQAWCIGGAVALLVGGGALAAVLLVREKRRRNAKAGTSKPPEALFPDLAEPVERHGQAASAAVPRG